MDASTTSTKEQATNLSGLVVRLFNKLRATVYNNERSLSRIWGGMKERDREGFLRKVLPDIPPHHSPDVGASRLVLETASIEQRHLDICCRPQINLQDLVKGNSLLDLLFSRIHLTPDRFVMADKTAIKLGLFTDALIQPDVPECTWLFECRENAAGVVITYGRLVSWNDDPSIRSGLTNNNLATTPGLALHILYSQVLILEFLNKVSAEFFAHFKQIEPLLDIIESAFYLPPIIPDLRRLEILVAGKRAAAEDHVWALRDDPGYFQAMTWDYYTHQPHHLRDVAGNPCRLPKIHGHEEWIMQSGLEGIVADSVLAFEYWSTLYERVNSTQKLYQSLAGQFQNERDLPRQLHTALVDTYHYLLLGGKYLMEDVIKDSFYCAYQSRAYARRNPTKNDPLGFEDLILLDSTPKEDRKTLKSVCDKLSIELSPQSDKDPGTYVLTYMGILQRLIDRDPNYVIISPFCVRYIGDLLTVLHAIHQLDQFLPWASVFPKEAAAKNQRFLSALAEPRANPRLPRDDDIGWEAVKLGLDPINFRYEVHEFRSDSNVEALQLAEKNLDDLWKAIDQKQQAKGRMSTRMRDFLTSQATQRPTDSLAQISVQPPSTSVVNTNQQQEEAAKLEAARVLIQMGSTSVSDSEVLAAAQAVHPPSTSVAPKKNEKKTSSKAVQASNPQSTESTVHDLSMSNLSLNPKQEESKGATDPVQITRTLPPTTIPQLSEATLKTFRSLFYLASNTKERPPQISQQNVVDAMIDIGFIAQKTYGSAWLFTPKAELKTYKGQAIQIELAYDDNDPKFVPPWALWYVGRRLRRAYGWRREMFVERSADADVGRTSREVEEKGG